MHTGLLTGSKIRARATGQAEPRQQDKRPRQQGKGEL